MSTTKSVKSSHIHLYLLETVLNFGTTHDRPVPSDGSNSKTFKYYNKDPKTLDEKSACEINAQMVIDYVMTQL